MRGKRGGGEDGEGNGGKGRKRGRKKGSGGRERKRKRSQHQRRLTERPTEETGRQRVSETKGEGEKGHLTKRAQESRRNRKECQL